MDDNIFYAHTSDQGNEPLLDHLCLTAKLAAVYGNEFGSKQICYLMGMLHDIGKHTRKFQKILKREINHVDHAIVGAEYLHNQYLTAENRPYIKNKFLHLSMCAIIAGHHSELNGPLKFYDDPKNMYCFPMDFNEVLYDGQKQNALSNIEEYQDIVQYIKKNAPIKQIEKSDYLPTKGMNELEKTLYTRMLFSCLVDADYTATSIFCNHIPQEDAHIIDRLLDPKARMKELDNYRNIILASVKKAEGINVLRNQVYENAAKAGDRPMGLYSMTAPTGTGKTLALIRFALGHAMKHGCNRIFIVLPYLSIISQNAEVYRTIFGNEVVLEDDSDVRYSEAEREFAERWDAPIIITTSVKFFECLFTNKATVSRKLHRIVNSVIVFDECQVLPHDLTSSTLLTLQGLTRFFHSTVLLSTATLPKYQYRKDLRESESFQISEIIEDVPALYHDYAKIKNTEVKTIKANLNDQDILLDIGEKRQVLLVFNTVKKALRMYTLLKDIKPEGSVIYLSSDLCSTHKKHVIHLVQEKLKEGEECYLVSTQCIEAGVDIDFPNGYREFAPLPSIIQTAGRVNRNGRVGGSFCVFMHEESSQYDFPDMDYRNEAYLTYNMSKVRELDLNSLDIMDGYYQMLYQNDAKPGRDKEEIVKAREKLDMKKICEEYKLIDSNGQCIVIVPYEPLKNEFEKLNEAIVSQGYCINKRQMQESAAFRVNRYMTGIGWKMIKDHCHQLSIRVGSDVVPIPWFIADMDPIYDEMMGLLRMEKEDILLF